MGPDYRISIQYHGQDHYVDLRADKFGTVFIGGRSYSITGDEQSLIDLVLPIIQQTPALNIDAVAITLSSIGQVRVLSAEALLAARMDAYCKSLEKAGFTGSVLVEKEGEILLAEGYGPIHVEATTPFYIGSVSKQFTAAAIMQLVEQGLIDLDKPIKAYLPKELWSEKWANITIHHLLTHTSGILKDIPDYGARAPEMTLDMMLEEAKTHDLSFPPGSREGYSNIGYILLGKIIEHRSGISYKEYVETNLLQPAGMLSSEVQSEKSMLPSAHACKGHRYSGDGTLVERGANDFHLLYAAGGIISTVYDLARWSHVLNGESNILSRASIARMTMVHFPGLNFSGYGLLNVNREGRRVINHDGELAGFRTTFDMYPAEHAFITVLCNSENFPPEYVRYHLEKMALDGINSFAAPIEDIREDYSSFEGTFHSTAHPPFPPLIFVLAQSGIPQLMEPGETLPTYPLSNGRLFVPYRGPGLEIELADQKTLTVYEEGHITDKPVKEP
jgi:CubicO group peptidase (beta-lactamase class C family)